MMHGRGKSDSPIVPGKPPNKAALAAEAVEGRGGAKGNAVRSSTHQTQSWASVSQARERIRCAARRDKRVRLTALLHDVNVDLLRFAFHQLKRRAAPGVDGITWHEYEADLEANLVDLHGRVQRGAYRAKPSRRQFIPKPDGRQRPLGIAALEDKIVQRAVVEVLNAIYETDFLGFSYAFRPGRSQHHALDALVVGIYRRRINWILDADIRAFFDSMSHAWLMRFLEHRIGDRRMLRLIGKWLKAGVLEEGRLLTVERGTPQGAVISPLLANIYLHYVYDLWVQRWRRRSAQGDVIVVRYADDMVVGFRYLADAHRFLAELKQRLEAFALEVDPDKTRIIEFGRFACENRRAGSGQARDLRLPGLYPHLWAVPGGQGPDPATHRARAAGCQAPAGQGHPAPDAAYADPRAGALPATGTERLLQLLRRSDQLPRPQFLLLAHPALLAARPSPAQPAAPADLPEDDAARGPLVAQPETPASLSRLAVRRYDPRQDPAR